MIPKNAQNVKGFHDPLVKIGRRAHQARPTKHTTMKNDLSYPFTRGVII